MLVLNNADLYSVMAPNKRNGKRKTMNPPTPQNTTNTKYGNMPLNSLHDINKLLGALEEQSNSKRYYAKDGKIELDAEIFLFNRNEQVVLRGPEDPLYEVYKKIRSSVLIKWEAKDGRPRTSLWSGCNIL